MLRLAFCRSARNGYFADVFRGFKEWTLAEPDLQLISWLGQEEIGPRSLEYLELDGYIMGPIDERDLNEKVRSLPRVCFSNSSREKVIPHVLNDDPATGRLAADSFLRAGYERLAVVHEDSLPAMERMEGFRDMARENHVPCTVLPAEIRRPKETESFRDVFREHRSSIGQFVAKLSPNTGVFCPMLHDAVEVREVLATETGFSIPESIGLIAGEPPEDPLRDHELAFVKLEGRRVGAMAGDILKALIMGRQTAKPEIVRIPPTEIHRGRTIRLSDSEILVERVRHYYETHLKETITVKDVARHVGLSRRILEMRLRKSGLPSPYELLTRMRLKRAEDLLLTTGLSIEQIAETCGYGEARLLTQRFKAFKGMSPSRFRRQHLIQIKGEGTPHPPDRQGSST